MPLNLGIGYLNDNFIIMECVIEYHKRFRVRLGELIYGLFELIFSHKYF